MLTVGANLLAHLSGDTTSLAALWKITRADAQVFRFTDHDRDIVYPADGRYLAASAFTGSAAEAKLGLSVDNLEASAVFDAAAITIDDLAAGVWDDALVDLWLTNAATPADGRIWVGGGRLGQVRYGETSYTAELLSITDRLDTQIGRVFSPDCDATFGDTRCGKDLTALTHSFTVTTATSRTAFAASGLAQAAGYFRGGLVTWATGANAGRAMEVKEHTTGGAMTLLLPMVGAIAVGDTGSAIAGCNKSWTACKGYLNSINFRGWPHLPGADRLIAIVSS